MYSKNMIRTLSVAFLFMTTSATLFAQSKPGCEPSACGPDNTKKEEAVTITNLRSDLQGIINTMQKSNYKFDPEVTGFKIGQGATDDESILFISQAAAFVRAELLDKLPAKTITPELQNFKSKPAQSKQKVVVSVKNEIQVLANQIKAL